MAHLSLLDRFQSFCPRCITRWRCWVTMLTGYCLRSHHCDACGYYGDVAMILIGKEKPDAE